MEFLSPIEQQMNSSKLLYTPKMQAYTHLLEWQLFHEFHDSLVVEIDDLFER